MGEAAGSGGGASGSSIAALGLSAYSAIAQGQGTQAADNFQADRAERAAQFGRTQADLADVTMRDQLNTTLGNIDAIRAAAHVDPTSPTTAALRDWNTMVSDRQRMAAVGSERQQAADNEAGANYLRRAGGYAMRQGYIRAGIAAGGALARGLI